VRTAAFAMRLSVLRAATRVRVGLWRRENWTQLGRFCVVGGSGYLVNLCVFALCTRLLGAHHLVAATAAFLVAVTSNFWWNRHWTFDAREADAGFQARRFLAVSLVAFVLAAAVLDALVRLAGMPSLAAQAIAVACATPVSFVGNKLWSFARGVSQR
jgi:putative flippase GtrA